MRDAFLILFDPNRVIGVGWGRTWPAARGVYEAGYSERSEGTVGTPVTPGPSVMNTASCESRSLPYLWVCVRV